MKLEKLLSQLECERKRLRDEAKRFDEKATWELYYGAGGEEAEYFEDVARHYWVSYQSLEDILKTYNSYKEDLCLT